MVALLSTSQINYSFVSSPILLATRALYLAARWYFHTMEKRTTETRKKGKRMFGSPLKRNQYQRFGFEYGFSTPACGTCNNLEW